MANQELKEKVIAAVRKLGQGTADEIVKKVEATMQSTPNKEIIAATHQVLTDLHKAGKLMGNDQQGSIIYSPADE